MKKGFTLIEMLVVVLIIGILSAFALPQYIKSANKARVAEAKIGLKALAEGMNMYMQTYHRYDGGPLNEILDVRVPNSEYTKYYVDSCEGDNCTIYADLVKDGIGIYTDSDPDSGFYAKFWCGNSAAECEAFGAFFENGSWWF